MDENILYLIIFTVLIYVFEHKVLPTLIIGGVTLWKLSTTLQGTITESIVVIVFLYAIVFFYAMYMIFVNPIVHPENVTTGDL